MQKHLLAPDFRDSYRIYRACYYLFRCRTTMLYWSSGSMMALVWTIMYFGFFVECSKFPFDQVECQTVALHVHEMLNTHNFMHIKYFDHKISFWLNQKSKVFYLFMWKLFPKISRLANVLSFDKSSLYQIPNLLVSAALCVPTLQLVC